MYNYLIHFSTWQHEGNALTKRRIQYIDKKEYIDKKKEDNTLIQSKLTKASFI